MVKGLSGVPESYYTDIEYLTHLYCIMTLYL